MNIRNGDGICYKQPESFPEQILFYKRFDTVSQSMKYQAAISISVINFFTAFFTLVPLALADSIPKPPMTIEKIFGIFILFGVPFLCFSCVILCPIMGYYNLNRLYILTGKLPIILMLALLVCVTVALYLRHFFSAGFFILINQS